MIKDPGRKIYTVVVHSLFHCRTASIREAQEKFTQHSQQRVFYKIHFTLLRAPMVSQTYWCQCDNMNISSDSSHHCDITIYKSNF